MIPFWQSLDGRAQLFHGDSIDVLKALPDNSIDSCVCDPPYGMSEIESKHVVAAMTAWLAGKEYLHGKKGFMGRSWDAFVPGPELWREVYRVLKPGGHLLAFASARTAHLMNVAVHLAGFEVRDCIMWLYGSGFPKNMDVSKAFDRKAGAKRKVVGTRKLGGNAAISTKDKGGTYGVGVGTAPAIEVPITEAATEDAKKWDGWGTALKPANEPIVVARKPFRGTLIDNVRRHGTGAINISGCRIGSGGQKTFANRFAGDRPRDQYRTGTASEAIEATEGRWPANLVLTHSYDCVRDTCASDCPVALMDRQSGNIVSGVSRTIHEAYVTDGVTGFLKGSSSPHNQHGGTGGASRFFTVTRWTGEDYPFLYCAKAQTSEREIGLQHRKRRKVNDGRQKDANNAYQRGENQRANVHPTVKPVELMRWLVRLVTPKDGIVLEPFLGSGTTAIAAKREQVCVIGIERELEYVTIARDRLQGDAPLLNQGTGEKTVYDVEPETPKPRQSELFG